jgi:hypothetical protein
MAEGDSAYAGDAEISSPMKAIGFLPIGLFYFLFAPAPWQIFNLRQALTFPEMIGWYLLLPAVVRGARHGLRVRFPAAVALLGPGVVLSVSYALVRSNLGTAYRHRAQVLVIYLIFAAIGLVHRRDQPRRRPRSSEPIPDPGPRRPGPGGVMNILGISSPISYNPAACLVRDGRLIAAVEEERLIRFKQAPHMAPFRAIDHVLAEGGITLAEVDAIAVGHEGPHGSFARVIGEFLRGRIPITRRDLEREVLYYLHHAVLWRGTKGRLVADPSKLYMVRHHLAHAASAFLLSDFDEANIISLDGRGGFESGILAVGRGNRIEILDSIPLASSWGHLYEKVTARLGFRPHSDEGKVMGLAAYGQGDVLPCVDWDDPFPRIRTRAFRALLDGIPTRRPDEPLTDDAKAYFQKIVDDAYAMFVADVAKGRGISAAKVRGSDFGEGRVLGT